LNPIEHRFLTVPVKAKCRKFKLSMARLATSIVQGAPFDLFLSADASLIDKLFEKSITRNSGVGFGQGQLVLASGNRLAAKLNGESGALRVFTELADSGQNVRIAIANPAHAPYGKAAKQMFESFDLWTQIKPMLVYGEKVSQATQYVVSGAVDLAVISLSLALAVDVKYVLVDARNHLPIEQKMVLLDHDGEYISDLYNYLIRNDLVTAILEKYGYRPPGDY